MMSKYVYVLGAYDESGPCQAIATLDRERLPDVVRFIVNHYLPGQFPDAFLDALAVISQQDDAALAKTASGFDLSPGWCGVQFEVIERMSYDD